MTLAMWLIRLALSVRSLIMVLVLTISTLVESPGGSVVRAIDIFPTLDLTPVIYFAQPLRRIEAHSNM